MDDNYKQYLDEYSYSGKIKNLRCYQGYQRIVLAWDNPVDQKSKTIMIEYDGDQKSEYQTLVDSVSIENLDANRGYDFSVFTLDNAGNLSVPEMISAMPVTKTFVENLTPPTCVGFRTEQELLAIKWNNLSTVTMRFAGKLTYELIGSDGFKKKEDILVDISKDEEIREYSLVIPELKEGIEYSVKHTTSVLPVLGNTITIDTISIVSENKIMF